jgi:hypothetical protein
MPVVLRVEGLKFFFYSNEGLPPEPAHIHVRQADAEAKYWLSPQVQLASNDGFNAPALRRIARLIIKNREYLLEAWDEHFS